MTSRLNQIIAIEKGVKSRTHAELTKAHHALQKPDLLKGIARKYTPKDDDSDRLPDESTKVQVLSEDMLSQTGEIMTNLFNVTAAKDYANCTAKGDVRVDGKLLLTGVPVSYLLFLEKQMIDLHTFVSKLPVLDASENWIQDDAQNCFATPPVSTIKTQKVLKNHIKAEATDKHPAQVETYSQDVLVGTWSTIKYSGALPQKRVTDLLRRVEKLQSSIKFSRESANNTEAPDQDTGSPIFGYLFGS